MTDLAGASVLILGGGGGLGAPLALEAERRGAIVSIAGRTQAPLDAVAVRGVRTVADLRRPESAPGVMDAVLAEVGRLDVVVNAVGVVAFGPLDELDDDVLEELFLTNTFVPFFAARAAVDRLAPGGTFVSISGVIAEQNLPGMVAYGASKAASASLSAGLAREARRRKISVVDARPGHTETGLADRPIAGAAPRFGPGLAPDAVARRILDAVEAGEKDLPSTAFASD